MFFFFINVTTPYLHTYNIIEQPRLSVGVFSLVPPYQSCFFGSSFVFRNQYPTPCFNICPGRSGLVPNTTLKEFWKMPAIYFNILCVSGTLPFRSRGVKRLGRWTQAMKGMNTSGEQLTQGGVQQRATDDLITLRRSLRRISAGYSPRISNETLVQFYSHMQSNVCLERYFRDQTPWRFSKMHAVLVQTQILNGYECSPLNWCVIFWVVEKRKSSIYQLIWKSSSTRSFKRLLVQKTLSPAVLNALYRNAFEFCHGRQRPPQGARYTRRTSGLRMRALIWNLNRPHCSGRVPFVW